VILRIAVCVLGQPDGILTAEAPDPLRICWKRRSGRAVDVHLHPHKLRHNHATHAIRRGMDVFTLQATLGQSSSATTSGYVAANPALKLAKTWLTQYQSRVHRSACSACAAPETTVLDSCAQKFPHAHNHVQKWGSLGCTSEDNIRRCRTQDT